MNLSRAALSVSVICRENRLRLKLGIFVRFVEFFHPFVDKHAVHMWRKMFH